MQHAKNVRISLQQHQTSELGLIQTVEEGPSRGDMLLVEHAVLTHAKKLPQWMQNHVIPSSIDAAVAYVDPGDREPPPTRPPTPALCKLPNILSSLVVGPFPKTLLDAHQLPKTNHIFPQFH